MPTQTPNSGLLAAASSTASSRPESRSSRMQSGMAPWPGSTTRVGRRTHVVGSRGDDDFDAAAWSAACCTACDTERRLPMP